MFDVGRWAECKVYRRAFRARGTTYRGIKRLLPIFFPEYSSREACEGSERDRPSRGSQAVAGTLIHHELERMAAEHPTARGAYSADAWRMYRAVCDAGLTLLHGEVRIYDEDIGYATAVDAVAQSASGRVVLLEYKTTNNVEAFFTPSGPVAPPLRDIVANSSSASQALAQVLIAQATVCVKYGVPCDSAVLLLSGTSTRWLRLPSDARVDRSLNGIAALHAALATYAKREKHGLVARGRGVRRAVRSAPPDARDRAPRRARDRPAAARKPRDRGVRAHAVRPRGAAARAHVQAKREGRRR